VPSVVLHRAALDDLERLTDFLRDSDPRAAAETAGVIADGLRVLARHPLIGRPLENGKRELLIYRGRAGYVAQYRCDPSFERVLVLAIRHQREIDS
jgi:plasmid stabilization system protein ParE